MKKFFTLSLTLLTLVIIVFSCKKDDDKKTSPLDDVTAVTKAETIQDVAQLTTTINYEGQLTASMMIAKNSDMTDAESHDLTSSQGDYILVLKNLDLNTTYYYQLKISNGTEERRFDIGQFVTSNVVKLPTTSEPKTTFITLTTTVEASESLAKLKVSALGYCYDVTANPTVDNNTDEIEAESSEYSLTIEDLTPNTKYFIRPYLRSLIGNTVVYGETMEVTTKNGTLATVITDRVTKTGSDFLFVKGRIASTAGLSIIDKGICYSDDSNLPICSFDEYVSCGSGDDSFVAEITGLQPLTTYYVRAYAKNENGVSYGEVLTVSTVEGKPIVFTIDADKVTDHSARLRGNLKNDGGQEVTKLGFCYSKNAEPTMDDNVVTVEVTINDFDAVIDDLNLQETYYFRAFAENASGLVYGEVKSFTTIDQTGLFSIPGGKHVRIAPANLKYQAKNNKFEFHDEAYIAIGETNGNYLGNANTSQYVDIFPFASSGYTVFPYELSGSIAYGDGANDITGTLYDWGGYNEISGYPAGTWRTPTSAEFRYILEGRGGDRFVKGVINGKNGIFLLPDLWDKAIYPFKEINNKEADYPTNVVSVNDWKNALEPNGVAFLPVTGTYSLVSGLTSFETRCYYWTSTPKDHEVFYNVIVTYMAWYFSSSYGIECKGVRLVQTVD